MKKIHSYTYLFILLWVYDICVEILQADTLKNTYIYIYNILDSFTTKDWKREGEREKTTSFSHNKKKLFAIDFREK